MAAPWMIVMNQVSDIHSAIQVRNIYIVAEKMKLFVKRSGPFAINSAAIHRHKFLQMLQCISYL